MQNKKKQHEIEVHHKPKILKLNMLIELLMIKLNCGKYLSNNNILIGRMSHIAFTEFVIIGFVSLHKTRQISFNI